MSGTLTLTPEEQTKLTISCQLEAQGFVEAAKWLRSTIQSLRLLNWDSTVDHTHIDWIEVFRKHRGSFEPFLAKHNPELSARQNLL